MNSPFYGGLTAPLAALDQWSAHLFSAGNQTRTPIPISLPSSAPMLLGIGPEINVIEPAELRNEIARLAAAVIERMR